MRAVTPAPRRRGQLPLALAVIAGLALAGCAAEPPETASSAAPAKVVHSGGQTGVELTPDGADRIGLATTAAVAGTAGGEKGLIIVPVSALLYEPTGATVVYVVTGQLTYTLEVVTVRVITGAGVLISAGLAAGQQVVTTGAAELLGVQNGVGEQT